MEEVWKDIDGFDGIYQVSNLGEVKSLISNKILSPSKKRNGYLQVTLFKEGDRKYCLIHRLVAIAFIDNPFDLPQVNHIDECKTNNCVWNLEWCSEKYNTNFGTGIERQVNKRKDKFKLGNNKRALKCRCIETNIEYECIKSASEATGITEGNISRCCRGIRKSAGGYHWEYVK